ncbi:MAG: hypothetical protein HOJ38_02915, partial [Rhodobiaceae bacterium]|nr:hypothetical protein [Rhodobiaceae bacterium]
MDIYAEKLRSLILKYNIKSIAPSHGLPILDIPKTMPKVLEGLSAPYKKLK